MLKNFARTYPFVGPLFLLCGLLACFDSVCITWNGTRLLEDRKKGGLWILKDLKQSHSVNFNLGLIAGSGRTDNGMFCLIMLALEV